jgi:hypothetical protein
MSHPSRRPFELVSTQHDDPELVTELAPRRIARCAFRHEHGDYVLVSESDKPVAVTQYLPQSEPQLPFLVFVRDALDLGDEDGAVFLPCEIEVRLPGPTRARLDAGTLQDSRELVLCVGVALDAALDEGGIDRERLAFGSEAADPSFAIRLAQCDRCLSGSRLLRDFSRRGRYRSQLRECIDEFGWQLVQVRLHRAELAPAPEEEWKVEASGMVRSQLVRNRADIVGALAQVGKSQRPLEWERAIKVEPPARLGTRDLQPAAGRGPVGEPRGWSLCDAPGGTRPGDDRALVKAVVKDNVTDLDPPDQRVARVAVSGRVSLPAVKIDADVGPVGDLEPEPLPRIAAPPGVDLAGLGEPVARRCVGETDPRGYSRDEGRSRQSEQDGADEGAAVTKRGDAYLNFAFAEQPLDRVFHPLDGDRLASR